MKWVELARLGWRDLGAAPLRAVIAAVGIAMGVAVIIVVVGLGLGAREVILREVVRELPLDVVEVLPRSVNLGLFELGAGDLLGGTRLDQKTVDRLAKLEGVAQVFPKLEVKLPLGARGGARLFGRNLYADLFMTGLPEELLAREIGPLPAAEPGVVPVVVSDQLLEIYNASVAPSLGMPRLSAAALSGFEFEIVIGRSLMLGDRGAARVGVERGRIVGVSRYAMRLGVTVPLPVAERLLGDYGVAQEERTYASVLLQAGSPADLPAIRAAVEAAGLTVDDTARRTSDILAAATALASLVGLLVLALAALNIAHSFFAQLAERRRELAILRAVGARQRDLVLLVEWQALLLGLAGGLGGIALAWLVAQGIDAAAAAWLPDFPFKPESYFLLPGWLAAAALGAAAGAAMLGALWPAARVARAPLATALGEM